MITAGLTRVFLFSDLVGSTELKQRHGDSKAAALIAGHDRLFRELLKQYDGNEEVNPGDEFFATFERPSKATRFALALVQGLRSAEGDEPLCVRIGIHSGEITQVQAAESGQRKLLGLAVDTAARLMGVALPGQILLSRHVYDSVRQHVLTAPDGSAIRWLSHGRYELKGITEAMEVFEVGLEGISPLTAPPASDKARRLAPAADEQQEPDDTVTKSPEEPTAQPVGITIPGYEILRELSHGGQGVVYQAVQKSTKRKVAVKVLLEGSLASPSARKRFEREIELAAAFKHPNIVSVYDSGTKADGRQFCAMEYVRGVPLDRYVWDNSLALETTLELFARVADAVQYAHQRGVIHRDLKPTNVFVESDGTPKVMDFGLAKPAADPVDSVVSVTGQFVGTLPYMSPEQARGVSEEIDTRSDVYALGVMLYQLLARKFPYPVTGPVPDVLRNITEASPAPIVTARKRRLAFEGPPRAADRFNIDADLQTIVLHALEKDRARRYQSAGDLAADIRRYLAKEPIQARGNSMTYLLGVWFHKNRRSAFWVVLVGMICGSIGAVGVAVPTLGPLLSKLANVYENFPSREAPLLAHDLDFSEWTHFLPVLGTLFVASMGAVVVFLVRTRNVIEDAIAGAGVGLVAGVVAFAVAIGWASVLSTSVAVIIGELFQLGGYAATALEKFSCQFPPDSAMDQIVNKYPDLAGLPPNEVTSAICAKIVVDLASGVQVGIWIGLIISVGGLGVWSTIQAIAAGTLRRRGFRGFPSVVQYFELSTLCAVLVVGTCGLAFDHISAGYTGARDLAISLAILVGLFVLGSLPVIGMRKRWNVLLRFGLYGLIGSAFAVPAAFMSDPMFGLVPCATVILLAYGLRKDRRQRLTRAIAADGDPPCPACGYDLRGQLVGRCPECGQSVTTARLPLMRR